MQFNLEPNQDPMPPQSHRDISQTQGCHCGPQFDRREFIRLVGLGSAAFLAGSMPVMAGPFETADFEKLVPSDKKLHPDWVKSLFERGSRTTYRGADLKHIGMPIGGLCAGQLYLGGDGRLWYWDIFNKYIFTGYDAVTYVTPRIPSSPIDQGFALKVAANGASREWTLDGVGPGGFTDITFTGEYPIGFVEYRDPACPVAVSLEAFSPFTPLSTDDSSLPATVMRYTLRNTGSTPVDVELTGHLENGAAITSRYIYGGEGTWQNRVVRDADLLSLECGISATGVPIATPPRPKIVFADFEGPDYGPWTVEGDAFGSGPTTEAAPPARPRLTGFRGKSFAGSYDPKGGDGPQGKLTSPEFTVERLFVNFLIAGGSNQPGRVCINLVVDGQVACTSTPVRNDRMEARSWDVSKYAGKKARIEIDDHSSAPWGHIDIDQIEFDDVSNLPAFDRTGDFGTMTLALLQAGADDTGSADGQPSSEKAECPVNVTKKLAGSITRKATLQPGQTHTATFLVAWHFPNLGADRVGDGLKGSVGRHYAKRFENASAVAQYLSENFERLYGQTKCWHDTCYDSTLPYWLLDRTFANASILATSTAYRFADGLFYGWEGVGCCDGTCTHVWSYEQTMGRLFPELDLNLRERVDYRLGHALHPDGQIGNRSGGDAATDGQAGTILRTYRDHQVSPNNAFLKRNWPNIKLAIGWLISQDGNNDGLIEGPQPNTMDETWYGPVPWMSGMYLAALRAGEEMALDMGDAAFAKKCRSIFDVGQKNFVQRLWNEEAQYFFQIRDPQHPKAPGSYDGCDTDQVYGQSWGHQVGLGRILPEKETRKALASLWKYNFAPDVGPYRKLYGGRWYAMAGEAGLLICTWPQLKGPKGNFNYCNECWAGIEHMVAGHMITEGLVMEGLAVERAVHDRYHASRRNPWNEVECGDHYARSMSSYGVFIAASGFEYHGPRGAMAFAPRLKPENFRSAFTAAEGWGAFAQTCDGSGLRATLEVKWGKVGLKTLALTPAAASTGNPVVTAKLGGQSVPLVSRLENGRVVAEFNQRLTLLPGTKLEVVIG